MKLRRILFILVVTALAASGVFAQERYVKPVDEAKLDPSFLAFRTKLITAAEKRDSKYILSIIDPKIKLSFGGNEGTAEFKSIWKIQSANSPFWAEFLTVIKNGGSFDGPAGKRLTSFYAPYSFNSFPDELDVFEYFVIFGSNVNVRDAPNMSAKVVRQLSYNVVKVEDDPAGGDGQKMPEWRKIKTLGGLSGYVKSEFVRSPIDYRAGFEKIRGVWKMTVFIAGD